VTIVPYSPLGRGFLTGSFGSANQLADNDFRRSMPRFTGDNAVRNGELLAPVHAIAQARGVTAAQVALAWVHSRAAAHRLSVVPIPGTRSPARLAENVAAATLELTAAELATLEPIAGQVAGDRYADMSFTSASRE
jgi:aryl-alcohol dehydrogenase-like predicted oxidoreductase